MKQTVEKKILSIGLIAIGITAIIFAIICLCGDPCFWDCTYVSREQYGGDAYTGIQNAAATTANNINYLNLNLQRATRFFADGMGYLLLIVGLLLLLVGTAKTINAFIKKPIILNEVQTTVKDD